MLSRIYLFIIIIINYYYYYYLLTDPIVVAPFRPICSRALTSTIYGST